jgi:hypothetical protein
MNDSIATAHTMVSEQESIKVPLFFAPWTSLGVFVYTRPPLARQGAPLPEFVTNLDD